MGYEVRVVLLEKSKDLEFGISVAVMDLCKVDFEFKPMEKSFGQDVRFYLPGNGKPFSEDSYGHKPKAFPAKYLLDLIKSQKDSEGPDAYRRYVMVIPLLEKFIETFDETAYVACIGY